MNAVVVAGGKFLQVCEEIAAKVVFGLAGNALNCLSLPKSYYAADQSDSKN